VIDLSGLNSTEHGEVMKRLCIGLLITTSLISLGCSRIASQAERKGTAQGSSEISTPQTKQPQSGEKQGTLAAVKSNSKYGLTLLLYRRPDSASPSYVRIRNDKTGQEVTPRNVFWEEVFPANALDIWSPDEEYLVLSCGRPKANLCVYQTARLAKLFEGDSIQNDMNLESLAVVSRQRDGEFHHLFVRWKGNTSFIFKATHPKYVGKMNCDYGYDIPQQRLRFLSGVCG
jgi:hypothetical protein